jgi:prepilin-type N-terminal cleavage/methylation domain-containing protein
MLLRNNKGFTLIEVLFAVLLLGIALIPIMQLMPGMYRINREMITENTLSFYAQDKLEEVKSNLASDFSSYDPSHTPPHSQTGQDSSGDYSFAATIDNSINSGTYIKIVTLQAWHGVAGSTYDNTQNRIELRTKVAKRP